MRGWLRLLLHRLRAKRDGASLRLMAVRRDLEIREAPNLKKVEWRPDKVR